MSIKSKPSLGRKVLLSTVGTAMLYLPIQQSFAQLEEIVVTSRRYEESITDAPLAVAVMDADYLLVNQIDSIQDILELTPGSTWGQFAKAQPALTMRGVPGANFGNASLESAVQVVYDGVPATKAFMMTLPVYDLERVEIMRGPQGTVFGRNATLGLMHFISARPNQETSGSVEGQIGERNLFGLQGHYNTALSDTVSGRIAFAYKDYDGAVEDRNTGDDLSGGTNKAVRASILYEPNDTFSAYVKAEIIKDDELPTVRKGIGASGAPWLNVGGFNGYTDESIWTADIDDSRDWNVERDIKVFTAELAWAFDDIALTWLSGYQDGEHDSVQAAFGTPFVVRDQIVHNDATILSTELRVDNHASGNRFRWLAGVSYLKDEEFRLEQNVGFPERGGCGGPQRKPGGCPEWNLFQQGDAETTSLGIFGEIAFDITEQLTLTFGGRYTEDDRSIDFTSFGWGDISGIGGLGFGNGARDCNANAVLDPLGRQGQNPSPRPSMVCGSPTNTMGFVAQNGNKWDDFSGKVTLSYAVNDNSSIYALYSEGFKAGGFQNDSRNLGQFSLLINPENVTNYEIGWKGSYDRAIFAVTAFSMEQRNTQVGNNVPSGSGNINLVINSGGIDNTGLEFEGTFAITDNITAGGSLAFYDAEFIEGSFQGGVFNPITNTSTGESIAGFQPNNSPDTTGALWISHDWDLASGANIRLRGDWMHRASTFSRNGEANRDGLTIDGSAPQYLRPELNKFGLDLSWTSADENLKLSIWGRNLDNKADYINSGPGVGYIFNRGQAGPLGKAVTSRPVGVTGRRQIGMTARYNFGG